MRSERTQSRRHFLLQGLSACTAVGAGILLGDRLFAEPTQLAARVKEAPASHVLAPALKLGTQSLDALQELQDYRCQFHKRELVGRKMLDSKIDLKVRETPFSVYLKFLSYAAGREVIFVDGENNGNLLVHEAGLASIAGTMSLAPTSSTVMAENRYPVTQIGLRNMVAAVLEQWLKDLESSDVRVNYYQNARVGEVACRAVETSYLKPQSSANIQMSRFYLDAKTLYPVRLQQYAFPGKRDKEAPLVEDYIYSNVVANPGLASIDFSVKNPGYGF